MLAWIPFNIVFGRSPTLPHDVLFYPHEHSKVHDGNMQSIHVDFGPSPNLPDDVLFDDHVDSEVHHATMHVILPSFWSFSFSA